jgi:succinoglycan biosynthesis transport protein ExoP
MSDPQRSYRREFNPITSLRVHWKLSLLLFVLAAVGLGKLAMDRDQVVYTSYATLQVSRTFQRTLQQDRELDLNSTYDFDSFRNDQVALLYRPDVVKDALQRAGQLGPPWVPEGVDPNLAVLGFSASLNAYAVPRSSRIEISLQSVDAGAVQPALDSLLAAFADAHRSEYFFAADERPGTLRAALTEVELSIEAKRAEIDQLSRELKVTSFDGSTPNPLATALDEARVALATAKRGETEARIDRDALQAQLDAPQDGGTMLAGGADWGALSAGLADVVGPLSARHAELSAELAGLGASHPGRDAIQRQIRGIEEQVDDILANQGRARLQEAETAILRAEAAVAAQQGVLDDLESRNEAFLSKFQRGRILETELPRGLEQRDRLTARLEFFEIEAQSPSYVGVFTPATEVNLQGESSLMRNIALALALAFAFAVVIPVLWDLRDDRVHTIGDVARALGFAPTSWIPAGGSRRLQGLAKGQTRRFAMSLDRDRRRHGAHLVVFAGVKGQGADLDFVAGVANALGQLGRRVLVIDAADADRGQGKAGGGLLGLLGGGPLEAVPRAGTGDFLPFGKAQGELPPAWDEWIHKVETATQAYDLVLVVAPAILTAPEAEALVAEAPMAVLVVEAESQSLGEVRRAGMVLESLRPQAMGAVLTKAKPFRGRGYYRELARQAGA